MSFQQKLVRDRTLPSADITREQAQHPKQFWLRLRLARIRLAGLMRLAPKATLRSLYLASLRRGLARILEKQSRLRMSQIFFSIGT